MTAHRHCPSYCEREYSPSRNQISESDSRTSSLGQTSRYPLVSTLSSGFDMLGILLLDVKSFTRQEIVVERSISVCRQANEGKLVQAPNMYMSWKGAYFCTRQSSYSMQTSGIQRFDHRSSGKELREKLKPESRVR